MKKFLILIVVVLLVVCGVFYYKQGNEKISTNTTINSNQEKNEVLEEVVNSNELEKVLKNEIEFIDMEGNKVYLKDYKLFGKSINVSKYAFIDFEKDETEELVVEIQNDSEEIAYIILREQNGNIYGYEKGVRELQNLKKDGSFSASSGATSISYLELNFENDSIKTVTKASGELSENKFVIDDKEVSKDEFDAFEKDWKEKEKCSWIDNTNDDEKNNLENAVKKAIIEKIITDEFDKELEDDEKYAEAHKILDIEENDNEVFVYLVTQAGIYKKEDGNITNISAMTAPIKMIFEKNGEEYTLVEYKKPTDGDDIQWEKDLYELFPEECANQVKLTDYTDDFFTNQIKNYFI